MAARLSFSSKVKVGERLPVVVPDDEARLAELEIGIIDGPRRREAALRHPSILAADGVAGLR